MAETKRSGLSVSKGCFLVKRKGGGKRPPPVSYFGREGDSEESVRLRYRLYQDTWAVLQGHVQELHSGAFSQLMEGIVKRLKHCSSQMDAEERVNIPAVVLLAGVNMPDHSTLYSELIQLIHKEVSPHVAAVNSEEGRSVKSLIKEVVAQLVWKDDMDSKMDIDEDDDNKFYKPVKSSQCTMRVLRTWYHETEDASPVSSPCSSPLFSPSSLRASPHKSPKLTPRKSPKSTPRKSTPRKSQKSSPLKSPRKSPMKSPIKTMRQKESKPPIVIILKDFELFSSDALTDFMLICKNYMDLPIMFIFGVSTTMSSIHNLLPFEVTSYLDLKTFQANSSTELLNHMIDKIFLNSEVPFKLGGKVFKLLMDIFLCHDFSVQNFATNLKFCMLEHFYNNECSVLCCDPDKMSEIWDQLPTEELMHFYELPSFKSGGGSAQAPTKKEMLAVMWNLHTYGLHFVTILKVLHIFNDGLPKSPLGKHFREIYAMALESPIVESPEYKQVSDLISFFSREEMEPKLMKSLLWIESVMEREHPRLVKNSELEKITWKLQSLLDRFSTLDEEEKAVHDQIEAEKPGSNLSNRLTRCQLQEQLLEKARKKRQLSPYDNLRKEIVEWLSFIFASHLDPPYKIPLHEVLYYDNHLDAKRHVVGMQRSSMLAALNNPQCYLQCTCCDSKVAVKTMPDICILYKLYSECGREINLYDWLQSFVSIVSPTEEEEEERNCIDEALQARFIQGVTELQFLGFIKPSGRKTDHVTRLTWGDC